MAAKTTLFKMRVRLIYELVANKSMYLSNEYLTRGHIADPIYLKKLIMYCGYWQYGNSMEETLEGDILTSKDDGKDMGAFHVAAAATVLGRKTVLVYPEYGGYTVRNDLNRDFLPRVFTHCEPVHIMISTHGCSAEPKDWTPNHFVLLLPASPPPTIEVEYEDFCKYFTETSSSSICKPVFVSIAISMVLHNWSLVYEYKHINECMASKSPY